VTAHPRVPLDRRTYTYLGERSVAIKKRTLRVDGSWTVKKGTIQIFTARMKAGIVDRAGQRL
jgi:hypothetical protein